MVQRNLVYESDFISDSIVIMKVETRLAMLSAEQT